MRRRRRRRGKGLRLERSGPWIAIAGLFVVLWCTLSTVLFAPWWGVALTIVLLLPQVWLVARWARVRPALTPAVPVIGLLAWTGLAVLGASLWDWHT